jgi:tRNA (cmo5U34)-methyltransferase
MEQPHFNPLTYTAVVLAGVPFYEEMQEKVATATVGMRVTRVLDLGAGTGETSRAVLAVHPSCAVVGIDKSLAMLDHARSHLPHAELLVRRLEDPLPAGPFDLVVSALAVHHLDALDKAQLFRRIAAALRPGGRFVLADVITPDDPVDVVTRTNSLYDKPSPLPDQIDWLEQSGFKTQVIWQYRNLVVLVADRPD